MALDLAAVFHPRSEWLITVTGRAGLVFFALVNIIVFAFVEYDPTARTVVHIYRLGSLGWWQGRDIFGDGTDGFIYLPTFAVLYTPFALLGAHAGDALWRLFSNAVLAVAFWRAVVLLFPDFDERRRLLMVGIIFLIMLPSGLGTLRNGQATTILYALMLLAALDIATATWWRAAWLLALAFAIKPLAIVYLLLAGVLYPRLGWRLVVATGAILLLPFVNPDPVRAAHLYALGIHKVLAAGAPDTRHWADITGLLNEIGWLVPDRILTILRLAAAVATLALGLVVTRRNRSVDGAFNVLALAVVYLMLMSPRTETQTYLMLGSTMALYAVIVGQREEGYLAAWLLALSGVGFVVVQASSPATELWLQPIFCLIFLPFLIMRCFLYAQRGGMTEQSLPENRSPDRRLPS